MMNSIRLLRTAAIATTVFSSSFGFAGETTGMKCKVAGDWNLVATVADSLVSLTYSLDDVDGSRSSISFPVVAVIPTDDVVYRAFQVSAPVLAGGPGPQVVVSDNDVERLVPIGEAIESLPVEALLFLAQTDANDVVDQASYGVMHKQGDNLDTWINEYTSCLPGTITQYFDLKTAP
jgi:hypothetical protein